MKVSDICKDVRKNGPVDIWLPDAANDHDTRVAIACVVRTVFGPHLGYDILISWLFALAPADKVTTVAGDADELWQASKSARTEWAITRWIMLNRTTERREPSTVTFGYMSWVALAGWLLAIFVLAATY